MLVSPPFNKTFDNLHPQHLASFLQSVPQHPARVHEQQIHTFGRRNVWQEEAHTIHWSQNTYLVSCCMGKGSAREKEVLAVGSAVLSPTLLPLDELFGLLLLPWRACAADSCWRNLCAWFNRSYSAACCAACCWIKLEWIKLRWAKHVMKIFVRFGLRQY